MFIESKLPKLLTPREAADVLCLSVATLAAWRVRRSDAPPHLKIGGAVRYDRAELEAWIEAQRRNSTAASS